MKYSDEQIESFLDRLDFKPHPYQVKLFKQLVNTDGPVHIVMARQHGRSVMTMMLEHFYKVMEEENEKRNNNS